MIIRKAEAWDIEAVAGIYEEIHTEEETGRATIGWKRGVYPVTATAEKALGRGDLYVMENETGVIGTAIINQIQVDVYAKGNWSDPAPEGEVLVLHTMIISPSCAGKGCGSAFVRFYEELARETGCRSLRLDTNEKNKAARALYRKLGYREIGIVPTVFNGIDGVQLVLLEKSLGRPCRMEVL